MDPEVLLRSWMPAMKGWEDLMKAFASNLEPGRKKRD
jgi:hypothetical protein